MDDAIEVLYKPSLGKKGGDTNFYLLKKIQSEELPKIIELLRAINQYLVHIQCRLTQIEQKLEQRYHD